MPCYRCGSSIHAARDCNDEIPGQYEGVVERGTVWCHIDDYESRQQQQPKCYPGETYNVANVPFRLTVQRDRSTVSAHLVALCVSTAKWTVVVRCVYSGNVHTIDAEHPSVNLQPNDLKPGYRCRIQVLNIVGLPFAMKNFHKPPENSSAEDVVVLLMDKQRVFVSKTYLTRPQSGWFRRKLRALAAAETEGSKDKKKDQSLELPLENTAVEHFVELLRVDLEAKPIDNKNVEILMKVATEYEMQNVLRKCEAFLPRENSPTRASQCFEAFQETTGPSTAMPEPHVPDHEPTVPDKPNRKRREMPKRHACEECGMRFEWPSYLDRHRRTHTKERPFECDVCAAAFTTSSNLYRHKLIHTDEKPFACKLCNYKCRQSPHLRQHVKNNH